jgi:hypothetical protein
MIRPLGQNIWDLRPPVSVEFSRGSMGKRGRPRIRSAEYWRAYYTRKQREWRAAHYWHAYYTRKRREQRTAHRLARTRRKEKIAAQTVRA